MNKTVEVFEEKKNIDGFAVQPGFIGVKNDKDEYIMFSSGWESNNEIFVYKKDRYFPKWQGKWYSDYEVPEIEKGIEQRKQMELKESLKIATKEVKNIPTDELCVAEIVIDNRNWNIDYGGQQTQYTKTLIPGVYKVRETNDQNNNYYEFEYYSVLKKEDAKDLKQLFKPALDVRKPIGKGIER